MKLESWLKEQRTSITRLHVADGEYATLYLVRERSYSAAPLVTSTSEPTAKVDHLGGAVRITVRVGAAEYVFAPSWISGRGLSVARLLPTCVSSRETADDVRGRALAALRSAAEVVYCQHRDLALEAGQTDEERAAVLRHLARSAATKVDGLEQALQLSLVASFCGREDGAEFVCAPRDCQCVACGGAFTQGQRGPVVQFGAVVVCGACMSSAPAAPSRAA